MIKYYNTEVVFEEIPDEVTLAVNITNCRHNCPGCHSSYLREDIGKELNFEAIDELIEKNDGITCFCFMGEGNDLKALIKDILYIKEKYPHLKIGVYSGDDKLTHAVAFTHGFGVGYRCPQEEREEHAKFMDNVTYYKVGPYIEEKGPLNKRTTNQRMFKITKTGEYKWDIDDITEKFWK